MSQWLTHVATGTQAAPVNWAQWISTATAALALLVALFKEEIQSFWRRPKLVLRASLAPPDCQRTILTVGDGSQVPCYYLRLWVANKGKMTATEVQVFVSRLMRKKSPSGAYETDTKFMPMNLMWSHLGEPVAKGISRGMGRHCDLASVLRRDDAAKLGQTLPGVGADKTLLCLELEVKPNTMSHLWEPGEYKLDLLIAAANTRPVERRIEIRLTGHWFDDEETMFTSGLGLRVA
jgi:hypothetical protein